MHRHLRPNTSHRHYARNPILLTHPLQRNFTRAGSHRKCNTKKGAKAVVITANQGRLSLGLDFGTSGARAICIDDSKEVVHDGKISYDIDQTTGKPSWTLTWQSSLEHLIASIPEQSRSVIAAIAVAGTTTTSLLVDRISGDILAEPILYNEPQGPHIVAQAQEFAPADHSVSASVSSLCKLLFWHHSRVWQQAVKQVQAKPVLLQHADWIASLLTGRRDDSDWHNAARLGYDAAAGGYPPWLLSQEFASVLPSNVHQPGMPVGLVQADVGQQLGLPPDCTVVAGTTDSVAAFLAAGAGQPGEAVSSLGSTLAIDLLSRTPLDSAKYGICSYRWGDDWIVDGGSNTGGAVLRQFFTDQQLAVLTPHMDPSTPSGLGYYPLLGKGQRFPVNDPNMQPVVTPRPDDDAQFLQGLLEGIASIEAEAYELLANLGATPVSKVCTAGGGAANDAWSTIRQGLLGVPVKQSVQAEAAYGAALLALLGQASQKGH